MISYKIVVVISLCVILITSPNIPSYGERLLEQYGDKVTVSAEMTRIKINYKGGFSDFNDPGGFMTGEVAVLSSYNEPPHKTKLETELHLSDWDLQMHDHVPHGAATPGKNKINKAFADQTKYTHVQCHPMGTLKAVFVVYNVNGNWPNWKNLLGDLLVSAGVTTVKELAVQVGYLGAETLTTGGLVAAIAVSVAFKQLLYQIRGNESLGVATKEIDLESELGDNGEQTYTVTTEETRYGSAEITFVVKTKTEEGVECSTVSSTAMAPHTGEEYALLDDSLSTPDNVLMTNAIQTTSMVITNTDHSPVSSIYLHFDDGSIRWVNARGWDRLRINENTILLSSNEALKTNESINVLFKWDKTSLPDLGSKNAMPNHPLIILGQEELGISDFGLDEVLQLSSTNPNVIDDISDLGTNNLDLGQKTIELDDNTIIHGAVILTAYQRAFEQMLEITNHNQKFFEDTSDKYWDLYADSKDKSQMEEALKFDNLASSAQSDVKLIVNGVNDARANTEKFFDSAGQYNFDAVEFRSGDEVLVYIRENQIKSLQDLKDAYDVARESMGTAHKEYQNLVFGIDTSYTKTVLIKPVDEFWGQSCDNPNLTSNLPHKEIFFGSGFEKYGLTCAIIAMIFSDTPVETVSEALRELEALNDLGPSTYIGTPTPKPENSSPSVGEIKAVLNPPTTTYSVVATDPDNDSLTYAWTNSNTCGTFTFSGKTATWSHPHPPCGEETYHPGIITVTVDDGHGHKVTKTYDKGSQDSSGAIPSQTQAELSAFPASVSGSHKIGVPPTGSPCPTPMGFVSLTSDQQGTWSLQSKPTWMNVALQSNQAMIEFNCDINPVPQTLNGKIVFAFTNSNGVTTLDLPVTVQVT